MYGCNYYLTITIISDDGTNCKFKILNPVDYVLHCYDTLMMILNGCKSNLDTKMNHYSVMDKYMQHT